MTTTHKMETINKEIKTITKNQVEILELKNTIIKMKYLLGGLERGWKKKNVQTRRDINRDYAM